MNYKLKTESVKEIMNNNKMEGFSQTGFLIAV